MTAEEYLKLGNQHYEQQLYQEALADYNKAIDLDPKDAAVYSIRGIVLAELGRPEAALADYNKAIDLIPKDATVYYNRGNVLTALGRPEAALADYNKAIDLNPKYAIAYSNRGNILADLSRPEAALADYNKAIDLNPKYATAYSNRGIVLAELGRLDAALADLTKAIDLHPKDAAAYSNRGNVLAALGRPEAALADYTKAIDLNPKDAAAYSNRGNINNNLGRPEAALADYNKAIDLHPKYTTAYFNRGTVLYDLGRPEAALVDYNKAIDLNPKFANPWHSKGVLFWNNSQLLESQRSQWAQRCFLRALILGGLQPQIVIAYLTTYQSYPKQPFVVQSIFNSLMPVQLPSMGMLREQVVATCQYVNIYMSYLKTRTSYLELPAIQQVQFTALMHYFMGDPYGAFQLFKKILQNNPYNLQAHYYLIKCCAGFFEDEEPYLEAAIEVAENIYQTLQSNESVSTAQTINQRYYVALLFELDTEYEKAIECIQPVWEEVDFLPLRYLYYYLLFASIQENKEQEQRQTALNDLKKKELAKEQYEEKKEELLFADYWTEADTLEVLGKEPFLQIGQTILALEEDENRQNHFAYGFPVHYIAVDRAKWREPFYHYAHYEEIANAITLFQVQASNYFKQLNLVPGYSLPDFWDCFKIDNTKMVFMQEAIRKHKRESKV